MNEEVMRTHEIPASSDALSTPATPVAPALEVAPARRYDLGVALAGLIFAGAGAVFLLERLEAIELPSGVVLPAVLVGLGLALVVSSIQRHRGE